MVAPGWIRSRRVVRSRAVCGAGVLIVRPRKSDHHLPPGVYFKHGAYYKVVRGIWHRIGPSLDAIDLATLPIRLPAERKTILAYSYKVLTKARQNARGRREFSITRDDVHRMLNEAGWHCAVTGIEFSLVVIKGKRPYAPSIDRIECGAGYIPGNCRIVCVAANYAMNVWGAEVLRAMIKSFRQKERSITNVDASA